MALFLFRAVFAISLLVEGQFYLREADGSPLTWVVALGSLAAGALLLVGFLTPITSAVVGIGWLGVALSLLPACPSNVFDSKGAIAFAIVLLFGIVVMGPGAFSVDARLFGRREIIIPPVRTP